MDDTAASAHALRDQAAVWRFLHDLLRIPAASQWAWLHEPRVADAWRRLAAGRTGLPPEIPLPADFPEYEQAWIATFDVGHGTTLCSLNESMWVRGDDAAGVLHENVLFYRRFGLGLRSATNDLPDQLRHQLEFLCHLCRMQADAIERGDVATAGQVAQGRDDYLQRHPGRWLPPAAAVLADALPGTWQAAWIGLASACAGPSPSP